MARNDWLRASWLAAVEVSAMPTGDMPVCVGIAEETDIDVYLADVAQGEVPWNSDDDPVHLSCEDENAPGVPAEQDFWMTSSEGLDPQSIVWDMEAGQWTVLLMNADTTRDVNVDLSAGEDTLADHRCGRAARRRDSVPRDGLGIDGFGLRRRPPTQQ